MSSRGHNRERQVRLHLEEQDYWVCRAAGSLGDADLVALKAGHPSWLVEVKSSAQGPYEHFGPADRQRLLFAAEVAGAIAMLAWWPPRGKLRFIPSSEWPVQKQTAGAAAEAAYVDTRPIPAADLERASEYVRERGWV